MQWEYKIVSFPNGWGPDAEDSLNTLGADGWEVIQIFASGLAILKRPLP